MHTTTRMRARGHRAAGRHIVAGRAPSAAEISTALQRSMDAAAGRQWAGRGGTPSAASARAGAVAGPSTE
jgi:hypothetical protein